MGLILHGRLDLRLVVGYLLWAACHGNAKTIPSDVDTLLAFKSAVGNPPSLNSWRQKSDPCVDWAGVIGCSTDMTGQERITELSLPNATLSGVIPAEIGCLTSLTLLDLSLNKQLTGPIPSSIGELVNLETLNLQGCSLDGTLPKEMGNLINMEYLVLTDNKFEGSIPAEWSTMSKMEYFSITKNRITGVIPVSPGLTNWTNVLHLHFSSNYLTNLPPQLGTLKSVLHILYDNNAVSGPIPPELGGCTSLQILQLSNNTLKGGVPRELTKLSNLNQLLLSNCSLSGEIPSLAPLTNLIALDLSKNLFSGPFPPAIGKELVQLVTVNLGYNNFSGKLPSSLANLPNLQFLNVDNNELSGGVPDLSKLPVQPQIYLANNKMDGPVPAALVNVQPPRLSLAGNPLCFHPLSIQFQAACNLPLSAEPRLWMAPTICANLRCGDKEAPNPYLYFNTSRGCMCTKPLSVVLTFSNPPYFEFTDEMAMDLRTKFVVRLAPSVFSFNQVWITTSNRSLGVGQVIVMEVFPNSTTEWPKKISVELYDQISSKKKLLWPNFGPFGVRSLEKVLSGGMPKRVSFAAEAGIAAGIVAAVTISAGILTCIMWPRLARLCGFKEDMEGLNMKSVRIFRLKELRSATDNFTTVIGEGGYGKVYQGKLLTGELVAIKRAKPDSKQGEAEFRNEIELLSAVRHRNLVVLLGFCKERGEQLLVYEFIPNGNVRQRLACREDLTRSLTWNQRIQIALGSARGLAYLHKDISPPIIHGDFKTSNILVDNKLGARVADFGLSMLAPEADDVEQGVDSRVKGTLGYMDPEFLLTRQLTVKSDVYSFGVVLMELLTGKPPSIDGDIVKRVASTDMGADSSFKEVVDPNMGAYNLNSAKAFANLALMCASQHPDSRPTMAEACSSLEAIRSEASSRPSSPRKSMTLGSGWGTPGFAQVQYTDSFCSGESLASRWSSKETTAGETEVSRTKPISSEMAMDSLSDHGFDVDGLIRPK